LPLTAIKKESVMMSGAPKQVQDTGNKAEDMQDDVPAGKKAAGAFRTISEVADELDVQQHVLRFWETKFSQVKPLKRGGGRRYYRPEDVALLKRIHTLLYTEGYTIKGVQKLLRTQGKAKVMAEGADQNAPAATGTTRTPAVAKPLPTPANEMSPQMNRAAAPLPMSDKQRAILQAMLGDLRDLRNMIAGDGK
jgi:DNA-binding transcriptional MerR regulator